MQELVSPWEGQPGQGQELGQSRAGFPPGRSTLGWDAWNRHSGIWDLHPFPASKCSTKASQLCFPLCHWYQCALENILAMSMSWSGQVHRQVVTLIQGFLEGTWTSICEELNPGVLGGQLQTSCPLTPWKVFLGQAGKAGSVLGSWVLPGKLGANDTRTRVWSAGTRREPDAIQTAGNLGKTEPLCDEKRLMSCGLVSHLQSPWLRSNLQP